MTNRTFCAVLASVFVFAAPVPAAEPAQRELHLEGSLPAASTLVVENLLGSVEVRGGGAEGRFAVDARIEAEAEALSEAIGLADRIELELRETAEGPAVHAVFPLDDHVAFHTPRNGMKKRDVALDWMASLLRRGATTVRYADRDVRIEKTKGSAALAVHLVVTVPADARTRVALAAGSARAVRIPGEVRLDVQAGDLQAEQIYGTFEGMITDGDVVLRSLKGDSARAESESGDLRLADVDVRTLELRAADGDLHAQSVRCDSLTAIVERGEIALEGLEAATMSLSSGDGDVEVATNLDRTRAAEVRADSGDLILHLGGVTPFRLEANLDKGSVRSKLPNAVVDSAPGEATVVTRGGGGVDISVRVARGDLTLLTR